MSASIVATTLVDDPSDVGAQVGVESLARWGRRVDLRHSERYVGTRRRWAAPEEVMTHSVFNGAARRGRFRRLEGLLIALVLAGSSLPLAADDASPKAPEGAG